MDDNILAKKEILMTVKNVQQPFLGTPFQSPFYTVIFLTEGKGTFIADAGKFSFDSPVLLFATPLQQLSFVMDKEIKGYIICFHSDFYCIEYHKARVACNGLLAI